MKTLAQALLKAGAPDLPTAILTREVPAYEIEFGALMFHEDVELPASERAVMALTQALSKAAPADVDSYLGVGPTVAEALVQRLLGRRLLRLPNPAVTAISTVVNWLVERLLALLRRLFRRSAPPEKNIAEELKARKVRESRGAVAPVCELSTAGTIALSRGTVLQTRTLPARLLFVAEPLLYLETVDEKRTRYAQHRRARPLAPELVPEPFTRIDSILGLPPAERISACGIERQVQGFKGALVGAREGAQWEVREAGLGGAGRRNADNSGGPSRQSALLVLAALPSSDRGIQWRVFLRWHGRVLDCARCDPMKFLATSLRTHRGLLAAVDATSLEMPLPQTLRADGVLDLSCNETQLPRFLGDSDRPDDTFLVANVEGWHQAGLRARARPANSAALRAAFYEFLGRRDGALRVDFDATCLAVATMLREHWGAQADYPSAHEVAMNLWVVPRFRAAMCMRRLAADLVDPYVQATHPVAKETTR
jgi:hypothetical protein